MLLNSANGTSLLCNVLLSSKRVSHVQSNDGDGCVCVVILLDNKCIPKNNTILMFFLLNNRTFISFLREEIYFTRSYIHQIWFPASITTDFPLFIALFSNKRTICGKLFENFQANSFLLLQKSLQIYEIRHIRPNERKKQTEK